MHESKRKKYDAAELMSTLKEVLEWASGAGDGSMSERARAWVAKQLKGAMVAAVGKQESARSHNTFFADGHCGSPQARSGSAWRVARRADLIKNGYVVVHSVTC